MSEWKKVRLDHIGRVVTGKTPKTSVSDFWNGDVPFVTPGDIQSPKHISNTARYVTKEGLSSAKGAAIPRGAICVSCIGVLGYTFIGRGWLARTSIEFSCALCSPDRK